MVATKTTLHLRELPAADGLHPQLLSISIIHNIMALGQLGQLDQHPVTSSNHRSMSKEECENKENRRYFIEMHSHS